MNRVCSRCGSSSFHYNRSRMRIECDSCGTPVYDPQQEQQLMQYDRTYAQAMSHLTAGNWDQTISLLKPLMNQHPTEKKLYLAVLRAATKDFRDIDMENATNRATASETWDKLVRLNGVTGEMCRYSRECYEKRRKMLGRQKARILTWVFSAAFCSILAGALFEAECYFSAVLCMCGLVGCLYKAFSFRPVIVIKQLMRAAPDYQYNPFI